MHESNIDGRHEAPQIGTSQGYCLDCIGLSLGHLIGTFQAYGKVCWDCYLTEANFQNHSLQADRYLHRKHVLKCAGLRHLLNNARGKTVDAKSPEFPEVPFTL